MEMFHDCIRNNLAKSARASDRIFRVCEPTALVVKVRGSKPLGQRRESRGFQVATQPLPERHPRESSEQHGRVLADWVENEPAPVCAIGFSDLRDAAHFLFVVAVSFGG